MTNYGLEVILTIYLRIEIKLKIIVNTNPSINDVMIGTPLKYADLPIVSFSTKTLTIVGCINQHAKDSIKYVFKYFFIYFNI